MKLHLWILLVVLFSNTLCASELKTQEPTFDYKFQTGNYFDTKLAWKVITQSFSAVPSDLSNIVSFPFRNPKTTMKYLGVIGLIVAGDKPITKFYQENIEDPLDFYKFPTLFNDTSLTGGADGWIVYGSIVHYLTGFALGDEKSQVTGIMAMKAITYSYFFDHVVLKSVFGRRRPMSNLKDCRDSNPQHTCDPHDFSPFQPIHFNAEDGQTSMPSFHVTMYASIASVYAEMYDNYWLPYGAMAVVFASNIKGHHHWVGDMVAGGLIGTMIGHEIVSNYRHKYLNKKSSFDVMPTVNGIEVSYHF